MLKLNKQDYDLDNLLGFNFVMLKEILMKLCKNQSNIDSELNDIRESDEKRDKKISDLEKKIRDLSNLNSKYNMKLNEMRKKSEKEPDIDTIKDNNNKDDEQNGDINDDKNKTLNKDINKDDNKEDDNNDNKNEDNNLEKENDKEKEKEKENENENRNDENSQIKEVDEDNEDNKDEEKDKENELDNNQIDQLDKIKENEVNSENPNIKDDNKSKEKNERKDMSQNKLSFYRIMGNEKQKENVKRPLYRTSQQIIDLNSIVMRKTQVSYDVVKKILHSITEMNDRINFLEDSLYKKFNESLENSKKLLSDHNLQSKSKFDSINNKIEKLFSKSYETNRNVDELFSKYDELAQKLEEIPSKNIDLMDIIKDKNEEDGEEKKLMSDTLKDSIFEKFELNDNRFLQEAGEHNKLKQIINKIQGYIDRLYRQINLLKQDNKNMKEDIDLFKENINEVIDNKNEVLKKEIKEDINNNINDINNNLDKKLRELLEYLLGKFDINEKNNNNNNNAEDDENVNNKVDKALTTLINKKVNEIVESIERMEEDIKNSKKREVLKNKEIEEMKQSIAEINITLKNKIGSHNLNELYDFYLDNVNEVKDIRLKIEELTGIQERMKDQTPHFIKRLETLTHNVLELQENGNQKVISSGKPVDLSNYINEKKLKNALNPIIEQIQKLMSDTKYINITIKELTEQISSFEKKEHIDHIESEFNEKITLLSIKCAKKYLEKLEFIKIIKNIEIQLKLLQGNGAKQDNDGNWLIANKPLKCFNCATCEANVSNSVSPNEYIPWNKYPYGDKQYWIGQGFSKLLQKINRRMDDNNKNSLDIDNSNKFLGNSMNNVNEIIKINNKMRRNEENHSPANIKKYKLPKVIENSRKKQKSIITLPVKDDEKENVEDIVDNDVGIISPQILKITKLNNQSNISQNIQIQESNDFQRNKSSKSTGKISSQLSRVQSAPMY